MSFSVRHFPLRLWLRERGVFAAVLALVFMLPFPLGSNRIWAWAAEAVAASGLLILYLVLCDEACWKRLVQRLAAIKPLLWLMLAWLIWNALAVVPVPAGWVSHLAPGVAMQAQSAGVMPTALTLDRYASLLYLLRSAFYVIFFLLVFVQANSRRRVRAVWWVIFLAALFQSVYGLWLVAVGSRGLVFGFYEVAAHNLAGSFVNRNHAVAYLALGLLAGLALRRAWVEKQVKPFGQKRGWQQQTSATLRVLRFLTSPVRVLDLSLLLLMTGLVSTHSRAGVASALLAIGIFLWCTRRKSEKHAGFVAGSAGGSSVYRFWRHKGWAIVLVAVLIGIFTGPEFVSTTDRLLAPDQGSLAGERWLAIQQAARHASGYWPWGVGPGAYQSFFVLHRQAQQTHFFDHAHNDYLEFALENGLGAILLLAMLLWVLRQAWRVCGTSKPPDLVLRLGASLALAVLGYFLLHGLLDFNARIPANVLTALALVASFAGFWFQWRLDSVPGLSGGEQEKQNVTN